MKKKRLILLFSLCIMAFGISFYFYGGYSELSNEKNSGAVNEEIMAANTYYKYVKTSDKYLTMCQLNVDCKWQSTKGGSSAWLVYSGNAIAKCDDTRYGSYKEDVCYNFYGGSNVMVAIYPAKKILSYSDNTSGGNTPSGSTGSSSSSSSSSNNNYILTCTIGTNSCIIEGETLKNKDNGLSADLCTKNTGSTYCYEASGSEAKVYWRGNSSSSGSSSSSTSDTVVIPIPETTEETFNAYFYANEGALYSGEDVYCGDKIYVTKCDSNNVCEVTSINNQKVMTTTKVYKSKLSSSSNINSCSNKTLYLKSGATAYTNQSLTTKSDALKCGSSINLGSSLGDLCDTNGSCKISASTGSINYVKITDLTRTKPSCPATTTTTKKPNTSTTKKNNTTSSKEESCTQSEVKANIKGEYKYTLCYTKVAENSYSTGKTGDNIENVKCADGYDRVYKEIENTCYNSTANTCHRTYNVSCTYIERPSVSTSGSIVRNDGLGTVKITATDNGNHGIKGYFISNGIEPSISSDWISFEDSSLVARENLGAGTYFVWVMNNKNRISYPSMSKVLDPDTSTTLQTIELKSEDGSETFDFRPIDDNTTAYHDTLISNGKYVNLANTLKNDSVLAGFDALTTAYELTVNKNKIAIYATLTSKDASYVEGFEPRTVDLEYGKNIQLIRIVNNNGKIRTYTFIINRVDDRESNNILSDIKISSGSIDFNPYVTNYDIKVSKKTTKVSINGTLESEKASFVQGYEPRTIELNGDSTSAVLKTVSEAGIVRSYVLTFIKGDVDETNIKDSTYLNSLSIPGTSLVFDKETYSYTVSVGYEVDRLPVYAFAESNNATVKIVGDNGFRVGSNLIEITVVNGKKTRIYSVYVNRKESGLSIASNTALSSLTVKNYSIGFKPEILDYTVKIKREKTLLITATAEDNRSEVYMYGNNDLNAFSIIKIKVIAENGDTKVYSLNIEKDKYNKKLEITAAVVGGVILVGASIIIMMKRKSNSKKDYIEG